MYDAGLPAPGARDVGTLGGETFRSNYDMIRRPPLRLVGGDHVSMAPLPELSGNTRALFSLQESHGPEGCSEHHLFLRQSPRQAAHPLRAPCLGRFASFPIHPSKPQGTGLLHPARTKGKP